MITIFGGIGRLRVRTSFVSQVVRIDFYYTARSHFSVENASLPSLDCITAFELHFEYDGFVKTASMLTCAIASRHMITIFGGIGRLRVRQSFVSQLVRIHHYTAYSRFSVDFGQP